jgi:hypothetical protein
MSEWPEYEPERLSGVLLRIDLQERRLLQAGAWAAVVDHLLRSASTACLASREAEAWSLFERAGRRMIEWIEQVQQGLPRSTYNNDFSAVRGLLTLILANLPQTTEAIATFLDQTADLPPGTAHNARLAGLLLLRRHAELPMTASFCSTEDMGLGAPWKRFALAIPGEDTAVMRSAAERWILERVDATQTHEWGTYNEVPIEVSGALALAERCGVPLKLDSNRIWPRYRV